MVIGNLVTIAQSVAHRVDGIRDQIKVAGGNGDGAGELMIICSAVGQDDGGSCEGFG